MCTEKFCIFFDNASYFSCSEDPTCGSGKVPEVANIFGDDKVYSVASKETMLNIFDIIKGNKGLQMIHIGINPKGVRDFRRPLGMAQVAMRFRNDSIK